MLVALWRRGKFAVIAGKLIRKHDLWKPPRQSIILRIVTQVFVSLQRVHSP